MSSTTINYGDLAVTREIIPFLRLRLRMLMQRASESTATTGETLVVAPCILGDCLSYLPAIQAFAEINQTPFDIVVSPDFLSLAERIKGVRRIFLASSSYARASEKQCPLAQGIPQSYDRMLVLRLSPDALTLINHIRCPHIISSDAALLRYVMHLAKCSILKRPVMQSREVMYEALNLNGVSRSRHLYELFDVNGDCSPALAAETLHAGGEKNVLVHTGSGWAVKQWSDEHWVELINKINAAGSFRFLFIGRGEEELRTFERIQQTLDFTIYSLINKASLWELFLIMRESDFFIGIDSGPRNLAHYANLRSVTLLNPAAVKNFMPLDDRDLVVEKPNRFPANIVNTESGSSLERISVDEVFAAFQKLSEKQVDVLSTKQC